MSEQRFPRRFSPAACLLAPCLALMPWAASASTPASWAAHDKAVAAACIRASGLRGASPQGAPVAFPDDVGFTALQIRGRYPQAHMKNRQGTVLCLYERRSGKAAAQEWASGR